MFWLKLVYELLAQRIYTLFYVYVNLRNNIIQIIYIHNGSQKEFFSYLIFSTNSYISLEAANSRASENFLRSNLAWFPEYIISAPQHRGMSPDWKADVLRWTVSSVSHQYGALKKVIFPRQASVSSLASKKVLSP